MNRASVVLVNGTSQLPPEREVGGGLVDMMRTGRRARTQRLDIDGARMAIPRSRTSSFVWPLCLSQRSPSFIHEQHMSTCARRKLRRAATFHKESDFGPVKKRQMVSHGGVASQRTHQETNSVVGGLSKSPERAACTSTTLLFR